MNKILLILGMFVLVFTTSCNKNKIVNQAANDFCICLSPLAEMNMQLETLNKQRNTDSISVLIPVARTLLEEADACMRSKEKEYGDVARNIAFKQDALTLIEKNCPVVYKYVPKYYE